MRRKSIILGNYIGQIIKKDPVRDFYKVRVLKMHLDPYLNMYFNKRYHYWALDPTQKAKLHDIVYIKPLPTPETYLVKHYIHELTFPLGDIRDPVTGRRCRGPDYIDEDQRQFKTLHGEKS